MYPGTPRKSEDRTIGSVRRWRRLLTLLAESFGKPGPLGNIFQPIEKACPPVRKELLVQTAAEIFFDLLAIFDNRPEQRDQEMPLCEDWPALRPA